MANHEKMRIYYLPMARPLTGQRKREKLNSTFDPDVIERARGYAENQKVSLPQLIERSLEREMRRIDDENAEAGTDLKAALQLLEKHQKSRKG